MDGQCATTSPIGVEWKTRSTWLAELLPGADACKSLTIEHFRTGGPGGQKRNRTSSAVRVIHRPTGIAAEASEHRSQQVNVGRAIARLRLRIALQVRCPPPVPLSKPAVDAIQAAVGLSRRSPLLPEVAAIILDVMAARGYGVRDSATALGISTARLAKLLRDIPGLLNHVNGQRRQRSLKPLGG